MVFEDTLFAPSLRLTPVCRKPTKLPEVTAAAVLASALPRPRSAAARRPEASIIVTTMDNLVYLKFCLGSLLSNTVEPAFEIIVVDNGSMDGTGDYLRELAEREPRLRVIVNAENRGFAPACNQGLRAANGEALVLLNDDTLLAPGWLARLLVRLQDEHIGLAGPVTNRTGNEAQIEVSYDTYGEFIEFARTRLDTHRDQSFDIPVATMFCLAMRRNVFERIGALDEQFEVGLFEDDDYSMRASGAGYRVVCAEDVFVHHFGETSFGKLAPAGDLSRLFHANRRRFEEKWAVTWKSHLKRHSPEYEQATHDVRALVEAMLPANATVAVVSKGDDALLDLAGRAGWHFPQDEAGVYSGWYPADSTAVVAHLEVLRDKGATFLVFPRSAFWWLDHYGGLREHLQRRYELLPDGRDTALIFDLRRVSAGEMR